MLILSVPTEMLSYEQNHRNESHNRGSAFSGPLSGLRQAKYQSSFVPAPQQQNAVWGSSTPAGKVAGPPTTAEGCKGTGRGMTLGTRETTALHSKKGQSWSFLQHPARTP